ncbi:solute carrier family 25 (mitochondrial carnitine/acylcarnitine transporter), member 20/29 [Strigomonas culicis]|nr:solute carrier family 25 (mitochondrial carnitine/acylcarnitine transporter), member 20/29 [Strigomonas culicis]|eukprot:EPY19133.1 solute carrier family 25 (mitochondrial carnitine/acylcarnitine transporter), member 20/29 [Strigomonas culicis]
MDNEDIREIVAGSVAGALSTAIEYPMDTIKVRMQDGGTKQSLWQCVKRIALDEGVVNGFFRGLPAPVLGGAIEDAVMFLSYRSVTEKFQKLAYDRVAPTDTEPYPVVAVGGAATGVVVALVLTPTDLIKCKMQIQNTLPPAERVYKNSFQCFEITVKKRGLPGLYRGHVAMTLREAIGCCCYFLVYHFLMRSFVPPGHAYHDSSPMLPLCSGGCAGVAFWTSMYPIDAIKTKQQTMKSDYLKLNF